MNDAQRLRLEGLEQTTPHLRTVDEIAAYMRMDTKTVQQLLRDGDLKVKKVGGSYRATKQQLDRYIEDVQ